MDNVPHCSENPVHLARFVEDLIAQYPGTVLSDTPAIIQHHIPKMLPNIKRFKLYLVDKSQQHHCLLLSYSAGQCEWGDQTICDVDMLSNMQCVIHNKVSKASKFNVMLPVLTGPVVSALMDVDHVASINERDMLWMQAVTRVLWVCLQLNMHFESKVGRENLE